jgi:hypothetical protein
MSSREYAGRNGALAAPAGTGDGAASTSSRSEEFVEASVESDA